MVGGLRFGSLHFDRQLPRPPHGVCAEDGGRLRVEPRLDVPQCTVSEPGCSSRDTRDFNLPSVRQWSERNPPLTITFLPFQFGESLRRILR